MTTLYYFTGTGNSLVVARQLAEELGGTDPVPIPQVMNSGEQVRAPPGPVGFVFPVYCAGLPRIVARFAEKVDLSDADYIFCACTLAESGMSGAFAELGSILGRNHRSLDAGFGVFMPSNYVPGYEVPDAAAQEEYFRAAARKVTEIAGAVKERKKGMETEKGWRVLLIRAAHPFFIRSLSGAGKKFYVQETCSECTTCEKVCPTGNITMVEGRPVWHDACEFCLACVNFCPKKCIQTGEKTERHGRYHHPDIAIRDMLGQHGRKPDLSSLKNRT